MSARLARARPLAARIASALVTVLGATFLAYAAMTWLPGDPLAARGGASSPATLSPEARAVLVETLGLDDPLPTRYARWLGNALGGRLGTSLVTGRPVMREIGPRLLATLELNATALALVALVGLPLGWWAAGRRGRPVERSASLLLLALHAVPAFWLALVLQHALAVGWPVLPLYGRTPVDGAGGASRLAHLALPAATLALHALAYYARFARDTAAEGLHSLHALVARGSGVAPRRVFAQHALRPSLVPLSTLAGLSVPLFVSGSVLIETVFAWPGVGSLLVRSIATRDVPVVVALVAAAAILTVAGSLAADLLVALADPRTRRGGASAAPGTSP